VNRSSGLLLALVVVATVIIVCYFRADMQVTLLSLEVFHEQEPVIKEQKAL
jgi:hypothetical protein